MRRALARWEPRVEIVDIDAGADPQDPEQLVIELTYRVKASQRIDSVVLAIGAEPEIATS